MNKIIVCTDGSRYAPSIYAHAAWAAGKLQLRVELLHVHDQPTNGRGRGDFSGAIGFDASDELLDEMVELDAAKAKVARRQADALLQDASNVLITAGIPDVVSTQRHGELVDAIHELHDRTALLAVGKRGADADMAKGHLGGNLERVLRASERPVLVASRAFRPIGTAVIAFDGRPGSLRAIHYAEMPILRDVNCLLVTVGEAAQQPVLEEAKVRLEQAGLRVRLISVDGDPREAVPMAVTENHADLLAMGAYGHGRLHSMFLGSVNTSLLQTCRVPALVLR
jgi:nucleotide-binding universal stress UspA family protein